MNFFKKIMKIIFNAVLVFVIGLVIIAAYNIFQLNILNKKYPDFLGYTIFEIETGSMADTIQINDVILVKITKEVEQNDIITFEYNEDIITHRIINKTEEGLITKGDANNSTDKPITIDNVIGKVIKIIPRLGIWKKVLSEPKVIASIVITLVLFGAFFTNEDDTEKDSKRNRHSFSKLLRNMRGMKKDGKKKKEEKKK